MTQLKNILSKKRMAAGLALILGLLLVGTTSPLLAAKAPGKGYLGINIEKVSQDDKEEFKVDFGLLVTQVVRGEAADKAGIKKYDVLQYYNSEKLHRSGDLIEAVREDKPGTQAKIKLVRDGKEKELTVTLGELKAPPFSFNWKDKGGKLYSLMSDHAYLGVYLQKLNKGLAEYFGVNEKGGALIISVEKEAPAEKAGLKAGDVIVKFNGKEISSPRDVTKIIADLEKGDKVDVDIIRHKKKETVKAELGERTGMKGFPMLKGPCGRMNLEMPKFHWSNPEGEDIDITIKEKVDKQMEKAKGEIEKAKMEMEKANDKIRKIYIKLDEEHEHTYI
jgi:membrane-associated protease RseP (regulator of RpoE activity)